MIDLILYKECDEYISVLTSVVSINQPHSVRLTLLKISKFCKGSYIPSVYSAQVLIFNMAKSAISDESRAGFGWSLLKNESIEQRTRNLRDCYLRTRAHTLYSNSILG